MKKIIAFALFIVTSVTMKAHQSDVSTTMLVEKEDNTWVLHIGASLSAFQHEIKTNFSETPYKTPEEFQQMVIAHVRNNFEINFNDNQYITLGKGYVKLGHETKVVFQVFGVPLDIKSVVVKNSAFKDVHKNRNTLVLLKKDFDKERFVLNNKNNHTLNLIVEENKFIVKSTNEANFFSYKMLYILLPFLMLGLFTKFRRKKQL